MARLKVVRDALVQLWWTFAAAQGSKGWFAVVGLKATGILKRAERGGKGAEPVGVPMRELGGRELWVRPATTDMIMAVLDYRHGLHLPPDEVAGAPMRRIVELGVNAGGALAGLGERYPDAQLLGAEPDARNVALATRNVSAFGARAKIVQTAIWDHDCDLAIEGDQAFGLTVRPLKAGEELPSGADVVPALSVDSLLEAHAPGEEVDFMLMTIEGTEPRVLGAGGDWVRRVRSIRVELHEPMDYRAEDCLAQLRALGFEARAIPDLQGGWALGVRP